MIGQREPQYGCVKIRIAGAVSRFVKDRVDLPFVPTRGLNFTSVQVVQRPA